MIGQKQPQKIEIGFSEKANVFYVKSKEHKFPKHFKSLINCPPGLIKDFFSYLEKIREKKEPKFYTFKEMEFLLNEFLIKRAKNCKVRGNYEVKAAS